MPILVIEHSELTGSDRLGRRLIKDGHKLKIVRVHRNETLPLNLDEIDGVISCGGPQEPNSREFDWVNQELNLLKESHERQIPVLGICLGCQFLALALGGEVAKCDEPELGWFDLTLTPAGRECVLFGGQPWFGMQLQWHHYGVSKLPDDAISLASSERCQVQAWTKGINTFGIQFHPECTRQTISDWIKDDSRILHELKIDSEVLETATDQHFAEYERLTDRFYDAVSQVLMPMHTRLHRQRN